MFTYADTVIPLMRQERDYMRSGWGKAPAINQKTDSAWSIVTEVDIEVEKRISATLKVAYPDVVFVGEEVGGDRLAEKFWLMDPIDGTMHYARGMPFCTSMLALIDKGEVVFGAIYDFLGDKMYVAEKGKGAFCNDERIHVSERTIGSALVALETKTDVHDNEKLRKQLRERADIINTYSAGFEFIMVASGKFEARICVDPWGNDYDYAPGTLLVSEAGGRVANIGKNTYDYRDLNFIASNKPIFNELTQGAAHLFPIEK